jgi:hypothetical protein
MVKPSNASITPKWELVPPCTTQTLVMPMSMGGYPTHKVISKRQHIFHQCLFHINVMSKITIFIQKYYWVNNPSGGDSWLSCKWLLVQFTIIHIRYHTSSNQPNYNEVQTSSSGHWKSITWAYIMVRLTFKHCDHFWKCKHYLSYTIEATKSQLLGLVE